MYTFYFLLISLTLFVCLYIWFWNSYKYWNIRKIYSPKPIFPFGNCDELIKGEIYIGEQFKKIYMRHKNEPYIGLYLGNKPILLIKDLNYVKHILIKDFMHFTDHGFTHNEVYEPLEGHLFNINGNRWKKLRIEILQSFTSRKIKNMYNDLLLHAIKMQNDLNKHIDCDNSINVKEIFADYVTEIMGNSLFGINDSINISQIRLMSKKSQKIDLSRALIQFLSIMFPQIYSYLNLSIYSSDVNKYFVNIAKEIYKFRKENDINKDDYMQSLFKIMDEKKFIQEFDNKINFHNKNVSMLSIENIAAQLFIFFADGVETSSSTASFALYELAKNEMLQEKVKNEIDSVLKNHNGKLTYDAFSDMKLLSQIVDETLRKYPPLPVLSRICTKNYIMPNTNIKIDKGTFLVIPVFAIHRDPDIYPEPMKFNPDRFSKENKEKRHHCAHLSFGKGPRMCVGTQLGPIITHICLITVLTRYDVSLNQKHSEPLSFDENSFMLIPKEDISLKISLRKNPLNLNSLIDFIT